MIRVDHVTVIMDVYEEFEGRHTVTLQYDPADQNDQLLVAAWAKIEEQNRAELAAYKGDGDLFV